MALQESSMPLESAATTGVNPLENCYISAVAILKALQPYQITNGGGAILTTHPAFGIWYITEVSCKGI